MIRSLAVLPASHPNRQIFQVAFLPTEKQFKVMFNWAPGWQWTALKDEIKGMRGASWRKEDKCWVIDKCQRNDFALSVLDVNMDSPYDRYDREDPIVDASEIQDLYDKMMIHQKRMLNRVMDKRAVLLGAEMGTGKTLVVIAAAQLVNPRQFWYVCPAFALNVIRPEFKKWNSKVTPHFMSYDAMCSTLKNWIPGMKAPDFIVFDESQYLKTPINQRTQYAQALTDGMRDDHQDPYIIEMSGAPAPKSPTDWWRQCEILRPGFIKEKDARSFEARLGIVEYAESPAGGSYPRKPIWLDDEKKCKVCGELETEGIHWMADHPRLHKWEASKNEVAYLYKRLQGLVFIVSKKECLDLPDKVYREMRCEPSKEMLRAARTIVKTSNNTITALTRLRELSDGFQYVNENSEEMELCERCSGSGIAMEYSLETGQPYDTQCTRCEGSGYTAKQERIVTMVDTPKDAIFKDLLEENTEIGRLVVYAGFTASIDRVVKLGEKANWFVIRVDGQSNKLGGKDGMWTSSPIHEPLVAFQDKDRKIPRILFVAHPATAKTSLTLTEACMLVYWSNTFIGDDRIQSEDRIHRIGMDVNRGATIVDILNLPTDAYVLHNIKSKRRLQGISLGQFQAELEANPDWRV